MQSNIIQGDVLEVAEKIDMVDLVFCSPPYEDARTYGMDKTYKGQEWVDWAVPRFEACLAHCRGLVAWVVEGRTQNYRYSCTPALFMADLHRRGVVMRKPPVFNRVGIPGSGCFDWLRNDYEFIVCGTNGGRLLWSDNTAMGHPPKYKPGGAMSNRTKDGPRIVTRETRLADGSRKTQVYIPPTKANPGNVIRCAVGGRNMGSPFTYENEAPFPESLAEFFVRSFCPPGGIVWDCFSGSGTTAAVALKAGRRAIASDIRKSQCRLTMQRRAEIGEEMELEAARKENK